MPDDYAIKVNNLFTEEQWRNKSSRFLHLECFLPIMTLKSTRSRVLKLKKQPNKKSLHQVPNLSLSCKNLVRWCFIDQLRGGQPPCWRRETSFQQKIKMPGNHSYAPKNSCLKTPMCFSTTKRLPWWTIIARLCTFPNLQIRSSSISYSKAIQGPGKAHPRWD